MASGQFGDAPRVSRALSSYLARGTDGLSDTNARAIRLLNISALVGAIASLFFAITFAVEGLWPIAASCAMGAVMLAAGPFLISLNIFLGGCLIVAGVILPNFGNVYFAGRDAGAHFVLLFVPPAIGFLILGITDLKSLRRVVPLTLVAPILGVYADLTFIEPAPMIDISPDYQEFLRLNTLVTLVFFIAGYSYYAMTRVRKAEVALSAEYDRSETLLANMLPASIATHLKDNPDAAIADHAAEVTILFVDIVGFTKRAESAPPEQVVDFLNGVFTAFDRETEAQGLEKIKTIGDAYMALSGAPKPRADHAAAAANLAIKFMEIAAEASRPGDPVSLRIGMHTGPVVAGVIGRSKYAYDVWGDTVNTAARMESHGEPGRIQVTAETRAALGDAFAFERRGMVDIKGKGPTETWWLLGRAGDG